MPRAGWIYVGVNMMDNDHRRLERLAELWGMSKAAAVRRLLQEATRDFDDRGGHTCNEGQFSKWGTSNPFREPRCTVCWPTMPTRAERVEGERCVASSQVLHGYSESVIEAPWWWHVAQARENVEVDE